MSATEQKSGASARIRTAGPSADIAPADEHHDECPSLRDGGPCTCSDAERVANINATLARRAGCVYPNCSCGLPGDPGRCDGFERESSHAPSLPARLRAEAAECLALVGERHYDSSSGPLFEEAAREIERLSSTDTGASK